MSSRIVIYTTMFCGYCHAAKRLLASKQLEFEEIDVSGDQEARVELVQRSGGMRTVPQIFIDGIHVGGYQELAAMDRAGKLEPWLANEPGAISDGGGI